MINYKMVNTLSTKKLESNVSKPERELSGGLARLS